MSLAEAALRTESIGLGPGVLVPSLRHPMVNATATRTLQRLAPDRVSVAFGTGFTGRAAMGLPPLKWTYMRDYITAYRGLLRGEVVEWEGARMRMMPPEETPAQAPEPPPMLVGAMGPVGAKVAKELGADGIIALGMPNAAMTGFSRGALFVGGTVLADGELLTDERVRDAAGPVWALSYHATYAEAGADGVRQLPGGDAWLKVVENALPEERHLAAHLGHLVRLNDADRTAWEAGGAAMITDMTVSGPPAHIGQTVAAMTELGVTEIVYQPCGPDLRGEMERFFEAAHAQ